MQGTLLALLIILIPLAMVLFLRTNAAILFFVLCAASTLQTYLDKNVSSFAGSLFGGDSTSMVSLFLLVIPFGVAGVAFKGTVKKAMVLLHALLSLGVGLSLVFIVPQFLPKSVLETIQQSTAFSLVNPYTSFVIAGSFLASVLLIKSGAGKSAAHGKKHGH